MKLLKLNFLFFIIVVILSITNINLDGEIENITERNVILSDDLNNINKINFNLKENISNLTVIVDDFENKNNKLTNDVQSYKNVLNEQIEKYNNNFKINMNPTLEEVKSFIRSDKTDRKKWVADVYDCTQFGNEVIRNARNNGIYGCTVEIDLDTDRDGDVDAGHINIVFNTSDRGLVYIEPQSDRIVEMYVGMNYADILGHNVMFKVIGYDNCFERKISD